MQSNWINSSTCTFVNEMEPVDLAIVGRLYSGLGISALPIIPRITSLYTNITLHFASSIEDLKNNPNLSKISCALYIPRGYLDVLEYLIDHAGNLKWIHNWVVGVDPIASVIKNKLVGSDIALTNARGAFSASLAEWVLAVSLHFVKEIPRVMENTKRSNWDVFPMHQIKGKTMGFLGFGDIAKASARVAKVFGMKIIACRKCNKVDHKDLVDDLYLFSDDGIAKVLAEADIVVSSLPATDETRNCLGYEQFSLMKSSAIFISIGRGCVVVEDGLAKVLKEKIIYGAALDVFQMEPLPQTSPLWSLPNILVTAHNADREPNFVALSFDIWIRNFNAFLKGARHNEEFLTPVDKTLGY